MWNNKSSHWRFTGFSVGVSYIQKLKNNTHIYLKYDTVWTWKIHAKYPEYTRRNNLVNLSYERFFFNFREDFKGSLHDFTCMLLSVTVQDIESTVQAVEAKGNPVIFMAFSYWRFFNRSTYLK